MTRSTGSETARRLTDLFMSPAPKPVRLPDGTEGGVLDANLVHVTANGTLVRSRSEVEIATILDTLAAGHWSYEQPLRLGGETRFPDFTIACPDGRTIYWEHLGLLDNPAHHAGWERKRQWYRRHGVLPHDEGGGPAGTLMWTDPRDGIDIARWTKHAQEVIGHCSGGVVVPAKKAAKKAAPPGAR